MPAKGHRSEAEVAEAAGDGPRAFDPIAETRRQWVENGLGSLDHMEATTAIMRLQQIIATRIGRALREYDLTFPQYEALLLLDFSRHGVLPLGVMGRRLLLHPATVTNTVDQLERKSFAARERHPTDRRMVLARITDVGRTAARDANAALDRMRYGLQEMRSEDTEAIVDAARRFRKDIGDYVELSPRDSAREEAGSDAEPAGS